MPLPTAILNDPKRRPPAPIDFAGEWVAWNHARTEIVAHGGDLEAVYEAAVAAGHPNAVFQKVPASDDDLLHMNPQFSKELQHVHHD